MAQSFFCKINGAIRGPFNSKQLRSMANAGKLLPDSLIRLDGTDKWITAGKINNLEFSQPEMEVVLPPGSNIPPSPKQPQPRCTHCGKELGLFRGMEGRNILCNHCKKVTLVFSRPEVSIAPQFQEAELVEVVDDDYSTHTNGRFSPTVERQKPDRHHNAKGGNNQIWSNPLIYSILFGGVLLMIVVGSTLWFVFDVPHADQSRDSRFGRGDSPTFKTAPDEVTVPGMKRENLDEGSFANQRNKEERDREERIFKEAELAFREFAKREMDLLRKDPSLFQSYEIRSDLTVPSIGKNSFNQFENTKLELNNQASIKFILDASHNASMDSSIGDKVHKGRIIINGKKEAMINDIKLYAGSFTLKFECVFNGYSWKVVSATRS